MHRLLERCESWHTRHDTEGYEARDPHQGSSDQVGFVAVTMVWQPTTNYEASERTGEYEAWRSMRQRCLNPRNHAYYRYGGRGITIDPRWDDYLVFLADMGRRPRGATLERVDNGKGYCPQNCVWATRKRQQRNRRNTVKVKYGGQEWVLAELAETYGVPYRLLYERLFRSDWPIERALHA